MRSALFIFVCFAVFAVSFSAQARYPKIKGKPGHCWTDETGPMDNGQEMDVKGKCVRADCQENGETVFSSCGSVKFEFGASPIDYSKPYPECCPQPLPPP